jgi:integrase
MLARGLQLMLRTGQRGGEVFTMAWGDADEASGWWTIPGTKTNNQKTHRVPLTPAALALIAEARTAGSGHDGWVFAGPQGGSLQEQAKKAVSKLRHAGLAGDYTRHDLRRTVATGLQSLDFPISTIAHVLNQHEGGPRATPIYARHDFDKEKRVALEAWGRRLDGLVTGETSRLVPFTERRR